MLPGTPTPASHLAESGPSGVTQVHRCKGGQQWPSSRYRSTIFLEKGCLETLFCLSRHNVQGVSERIVSWDACGRGKRTSTSVSWAEPSRKQVEQKALAMWSPGPHTVTGTSTFLS